MTDVPATTNGARGTLSWLLLLLAAATLVAAVVVSWARGVLFDRNGFRATVVSVLEPYETRHAIVQLALENAYPEDPQMGESASRDLMEPLSGVLGTDAFRGLLDLAAEQTFDVLVARGEEDVRVDATRLRDRALDLVGPDRQDAWVQRLGATPTPYVITVFRDEQLPSLAVYDERTRVVPYLLLVAAFGLALVGVRLASDRGTAAGLFVLLATLLTAGVALLTWWLPGQITTETLGSAEGVLLRGGARTLMASLRARLLIVCVAGGLMLLLRWRVLTNVEGAGK